jgi:hypothetical protein
MITSAPMIEASTPDSVTADTMARGSTDHRRSTLTVVEKTELALCCDNA